MRVFHIVCLKLRPEADAESIFRALNGLVGVIPGLLTFAGGRNTSEEGLTRGYTHAFHMTFESAEARDGYLPHPEHERVKSLILANLQGEVPRPLYFLICCLHALLFPPQKTPSPCVCAISTLLLGFNDACLILRRPQQGKRFCFSC